jgi:hypothetical protein
MGMLYRTEWQIVSSEETTGVLLLGVSIGKLYARHESSGDTMTINYRCVSVGNGKGPPAGASWSNTSDPSGQFDNVGVVPGRFFSPLSFPCRGYMFGAGASSGVVGSALGMDITGGGVTVAIFGILPVFAGVRLWGLGRSALPGVGLTGGLAHFFID